MDAETQNQLTHALDTAMVSVLRERTKRLVAQSADIEVAHEIIGALKGLRGLQAGTSPDYDNPWVAALYVAWYQPSHINMAYTLFTQAIPVYDDTLSAGIIDIHLEDYACGPFAGQFAFALSASEAQRRVSGSCRYSIYSDDSSDPMWRMGLDLWKKFRQEIGAVPADGKDYPHLDSVRVAARLLLTNPKDLPERIWLTVFHAAYSGGIGAGLKSDIDELISERPPRLVLITANKYERIASQMYYPPLDVYLRVAHRKTGPEMVLAGQFPQTTQWRNSLFERFIQPNAALLRKEGVFDFAQGYLTAYPTSWVSHDFSYVYSLYERR